MLQNMKIKSRLIWGILLIGAIFMGIVAFNDFTPDQKPVEKTVVYGKK